MPKDLPYFFENLYEAALSTFISIAFQCSRSTAPVDVFDWFDNRWPCCEVVCCSSYALVFHFCVNRAPLLELNLLADLVVISLAHAFFPLKFAKVRFVRTHKNVSIWGLLPFCLTFVKAGCSYFITTTSFSFLVHFAVQSALHAAVNWKIAKMKHSGLSFWCNSQQRWKWQLTKPAVLTIIISYWKFVLHSPKRKVPLEKCIFTTGGACRAGWEPLSWRTKH